MRLPEFLIKPMAKWARSVMRSRKPAVIVLHDRREYLHRYIILKSRLLSIYVHKFVASDDDMPPHDHPWPSLSFVLSGVYQEKVFVTGEHAGIKRFSESRTISRGDIVFRSPWFTHYIFIGSLLGPYPVTLFIAGPRIRRWFFWKKDLKSGNRYPINAKLFLEERNLR